jgi:hypothetical protein
VGKCGFVSYNPFKNNLDLVSTNMNIKLIIVLFLLSTMTSCYIDKSWDKNGNTIIATYRCWGTGSGVSSKGPSRCNVYSKIYNNKGELIELWFEKKSHVGCTGHAIFYKRVKKYDSNGNVNYDEIEIKEKNPYR